MAMIQSDQNAALIRQRLQVRFLFAGQLFGFPFPYYINVELPGTPSNKYSMRTYKRINEDYIDSIDQNEYTDELSMNLDANVDMLLNG